MQWYIFTSQFVYLRCVDLCIKVLFSKAFFFLIRQRTSFSWSAYLVFLLSDTSQNAVTMIQRPPLLILSGTSLHRLYNITYECCFLSMIRHSMSSLWYNFAWYLLSDTSQHPVAMIQSPPCFFSFLYVTLRRHYKQIYSKPSQWYTVIRFKRHMFVFFLLSRSTLSPWYNVNIVFFFLIRHNKPSTWNNVIVVPSIW